MSVFGDLIFYYPFSTIVPTLRLNKFAVLNDVECFSIVFTRVIFALRVEKSIVLTVRCACGWINVLGGSLCNILIYRV